MFKAFITDIDGTLTDARRRLSLSAVSEIRNLIDSDIPVVFASGNTVCFLDTLSHMIGTSGIIIAENGGVYRNGYLNQLKITGNYSLCYKAYQKICDELHPKGDELRLFSAPLRHSDIAFSRDTDIDTVKSIIAGMDIEVLDTGFAIHLHSPGISKGKAFLSLAKEMNLAPSDFFAAGDSENDVSMLEYAGGAVSPANSTPHIQETVRTKKTNGYVSEKFYGEAIADVIKEVF